MDFFKEFSKQLTGKGRSSSEKAKEGAEVNRLTAELREAEASLERLYARYGKVCYAVREGRGSADAEAELALRIRATELQVRELTEARDAAREWKRCLNCGAVWPKEARFCSACGKKLPEEPPKPEPVEPGEYCPVCGVKREDDAPRCPVCGADFTEPAPAEPAPVSDPAPEGPALEEPDGEME